MTHKLTPVVEALDFYADPENFLFMEKYGLLEYGDSNIHLQGTNCIGTKATEALSLLRTYIASESNGGE